MKAKGYDTTQGFVVQSGSFAAREHVPSLEQHVPSVYKVREDLKASGVLVPDTAKDALRFSQDYTFTSSSLASSVVLGRSSNGREYWKTESGKSLKQIQEEEAKRPA